MSIGLIKDGIRYLAPRQSHKTFFLAYRDLAPEQQQSTIGFEYSFQDSRGNVFPRLIQINLSLYYDTTRLGRGFEAEAIQELRDLNRTLRDMTRDFSDYRRQRGDVTE